MAYRDLSDLQKVWILESLIGVGRIDRADVEALAGAAHLLARAGKTGGQPAKGIGSVLASLPGPKKPRTEAQQLSDSVQAPYMQAKRAAQVAGVPKSIMGEIEAARKAEKDSVKARRDATAAYLAAIEDYKTKARKSGSGGGKSSDRKTPDLFSE